LMNHLKEGRRFGCFVTRHKSATISSASIAGRTACLDNWHDSTIDHVQPLSRGGKRQLENEVASCNYYSSIKGERLFVSVAEAKEYAKKRRDELQKDYERVYAEIRGGKPNG